MTPSLRALAFFLLPTLGACIVYDESCPDDRGGRGQGEDDTSGDDHGGEDTAAPDPDEDSDGEALGMSLDPSSGLPGEELISSLTATQAFDWARVEQLRFFGPVRPCAFQARPDELLITLVVEEEAEAGPVDLLLELDDGGAVWLEDAFTVLSTAEEPTAPVEESPCG